MWLTLGQNRSQANAGGQPTLHRCLHRHRTATRFTYLRVPHTFLGGRCGAWPEPSHHTAHTYFGERARIKRSPTFTVHFFCREEGGGDMIVTRSENCVPGLAFSQKHHNLCRTVRGRTLGYGLVFLFILSVSFLFLSLLLGRRLDTLVRECRKYVVVGALYSSGEKEASTCAATTQEDALIVYVQTDNSAR
jgi:hypothetical protein